MLEKTKISKKLPIMFTLAAVAPLLAVLLILLVFQNRLEGIIIDEGMHRMAGAVYDQCKAQAETIDKYLDMSLRFAKAALRSGVGESAQTTLWNVKNQFSGAERTITLPKLMVGGRWLGQSTSFSENVPVVDEVTAKTGAVCTLFQRMNEEGDMLRIATTVKTKSGARAVGTYIPSQTNGVHNAVISSILSGNSYSGRAYVVDAWYYVKYEPLQNASGKVIGMSFVGVKESELKTLRDYILSQKIGRNGYIFVLQGQGENRGQYVVSKDGLNDGQNIWEAKDASGAFFIQRMIAQTLAAGDGKVSKTDIYPWKNPGETKARDKIAYTIYYKPWDWVISVSTYVDEASLVAGASVAALSRAILVIVALGLLLSAGAVFVGIAMARSISVPLDKTASQIGEIAKGDFSQEVRREFTDRGDEIGDISRSLDTLNKEVGALIVQVKLSADQLASATEQISSSANQISDGAQQQSASFEELSSSVQSNATNAVQANELAKNTASSAASTGTEMAQLVDAIGGIERSARQMSEAVAIITDIADQTNLLALNAAIEAARAGEHGKGFAVVADEVRKLAEKSAASAKEIHAHIKESIDRVENGVAVSKTAQANLQKILGDVTSVSGQIQMISGATQEQAAAMEQNNSITEGNASAAAELASASEELASHAEALRRLVERFKIRRELYAGASSAAPSAAALQSCAAKTKAPVGKKEQKLKF